MTNRQSRFNLKKEIYFLHKLFYHAVLTAFKQQKKSSPLLVHSSLDVA